VPARPGLRDVAPEELIRRPAPEKWSIAEIVAHLADAELAMGWRLRNMLATPGVAFPRRFGPHVTGQLLICIVI
jgi:DinB superfamily